MKKNYKAKLLGAIAALGLAVASTVGSTYAWFSMNKTVTATGMQVRAKAEGSIVITATSSLPAAGTVATNLAISDASATELYASTHDDSRATLLKYVTNADQINPETGVGLNSGSVLTYDNAQVAGKVFFKDYTLYIAGDGQGFTAQDIIVSITTNKLSNINDALSIDFYGEAVSSAKTADVKLANYLNTLNLAGLDAAANDGTAKVNFEIENITIPQTGTNEAYAITMRVYYDGQLLETVGDENYTFYKAATGTAEAGKYYYIDENGSSVATVAVGASVAGLYVVDDEKSSYAYARTTSVAAIDDVVLNVSFTAKAHD